MSFSNEFGKIHAVRGMNDILPDQVQQWQLLEQLFRHCLTQYDYQEIRLPIIEHTQLFKRTIGEVTDIVTKEMYTFTDLNGDSLTLRPEGTAGCARACIEHGLLHNQQQKLWYIGPMYRHERPQKGRYRQFTQLGVEVLGIAGFAIEVEMMAMCQRLWKKLDLSDSLTLEINTLGELNERQLYKEHLVSFLQKNIEFLDSDALDKLNRNPLRILDSKNKAIIEILKGAPKLIDFISKNSRQKFDLFCTGMTNLGINYVINPHLVRGLDYYGHTVFEWVTNKLGSQNTICAGGRYDWLINQLGGKLTPSVGLAIGVERLLLLLETTNKHLSAAKQPSVFIIPGLEAAFQKCLYLAEMLRDNLPDWKIITNTVGSGFKSQFKKANKSGAELALIIGENELRNNQVCIKKLLEFDDQVTILETEILDYLQKNIIIN